ncbi:DUF3253 domain-containing protein [Neorhizobium huautlense]|uniref:DUF3253 domain-containing protein n=1 Tax=Neorhizobium huautlense TaxID=67774 RepID=UPI0035936FFA
MKRDAEAAILSFVASRREGTTCPSEIARALANNDTRPLERREYMPIVHEAVDALNARGDITLTWKSVLKKERAGPYRIGNRS